MKFSTTDYPVSLYKSLNNHYLIILEDIDSEPKYDGYGYQLYHNHNMISSCYGFDTIEEIISKITETTGEYFEKVNCVIDDYYGYTIKEYEFGMMFQQ